MALNHVISEQKQKRFKLCKGLNSVENLLRNNLPSDIFLKIKDMALRSFRHEFHLSKVRLADKFNRFLFEKVQDSDVFYPRFVWVLQLRICHLNLSIINRRQFCRRVQSSVFQHPFIIQK
jgi:hypothetical protein